MKKVCCRHWALLASAMAVLFAAVSVSAPAVTVNSSADSGGTCPGSDCTLRQAIAAAASGDTITFSLPANSTITLTSAELLINKSLTITGPGATQLTVQRSTATGTAQFRIFDISGVVNVSISGLTIANGSSLTGFTAGGGIYNNGGTVTVANSTISGNATATTGGAHGGGGLYSNGTLTVTNSIISGNVSNNASQGGGGIYNAGTLTVSGSTISGNAANNSTVGGGGLENAGTATISNSTISGNTMINSSGGKGAGIYNAMGTLTMTSSTISANNADTGSGGGIENDATLTVVNSTISGNAATFGAGLSNSGGGSATATFTNTTIAANSAKSVGGGINSSGSTIMIKNTIIATNTATAGTGPDLSGSVVSNGFNFIGSNANATFAGGAASTDQVGTAANPKNPMLGALQDNRGVTQTQALLSGSPAIEAGNSTSSGTDQRGFARPVDDPGVPNASGGDGSDIGAYEVQANQLPGCRNLNTVVNNTGDSGAGSLRDVIANVCAGSTITFASNVRGAITLASSELVVNKSLSIIGPGANLLSVQRTIASDTSPFFRIFNLSSANSNVSISGLRVTGGSTLGGIGGGIVSRGGLSLDGMVVANNAANGGNGGGIYLGGTSVITNTTISGNTINSNSGTGSGGGIFNFGAIVAITNCTISGNSAIGPSASHSDHGGALYTNVGSVTFTGSTLTANSSDNGGGLLAENGGVIKARNTIIALNTSASGPDVKGPITSQGFNIFGDSTGSAISPAQFSDQIGNAGSPINPLLGSLQDNGGPTPTRALFSGSSAINKGDPNAPSRDQRGYVRQDAPDVGAYEFNGTIPATLANISTRLAVQTGDNVLIGGFIITGTQPKKVILRAIGPSLNLPGKLADPTLELYQGQTLLEANDNWMDSPNKQAIIDSTIPPSDPLESAIVRSVAPGNYTAVVRGANNGTGIGVVEAYDLDRTVDSKLANIATRGPVQTGDNVLFGGFIVLGPDSQKVIVRALGPSVPLAGTLADPTLELRDGNGALLESNDNWVDSANKQAIIDSTIPPANNVESAIVRTLTPGNYTAIVHGVNSSTGIAVVEVYALQ